MDNEEVKEVTTAWRTRTENKGVHVPSRALQIRSSFRAFCSVPTSALHFSSEQPHYLADLQASSAQCVAFTFKLKQTQLDVSQLPSVTCSNPRSGPEPTSIP